MTTSTDVSFSLWTAIKLGAGFAVGASLVSILASIILLWPIAVGLSLPSK